MEPEGSLPQLQVPAKRPYPESDPSNNIPNKSIHVTEYIG
jgi:hypothetical protein